ncbi:GNAT family N-acetyltransferase [Staphylococcus sp. NRL 16/872]|uniref:GNAT family N-acetyltransferase n=1 Tax=Staphylococcus sp. NRL 16/872 TaxID=2930131 RepID=UPI001FB53279|nr:MULTISPECIES: GNAT family N-acetyltransferase [unclassified Staphylococcus]MCJ1655693.1 GNAT family N-acetyltransferase [Staphylococcus sp. NRL 21/187]MCJ1661510.1 GNAT family N-acetyltransferase [Staphylococcus sp. NRL 18/288]MCJ1667423.1 GNAT family N-acetyltransferase [Staphylococcus sp. NRL 19/737]WEN69904.1 GNAT family N-acetyltransferase [Staphylococcus sp. NRL 16/872]
MIRFSKEVPEAQAYCDLRVKAGMSSKSLEAARKGLPNACFTITIYDNDKLIGMGRLIGDGGTAFQIVDIAVDPEYQGQGHGRQILEKIMTYIESVAEKGTYVSLIADYPADKLYEKFGFQSTEPKSGGMYQIY